MKRLLIFSFLFLQFFCACNNQTENNEPLTSENDVDAARNFIRNLLDGKLDDARNMLVEDSLNIQNFETYERFYKTRMSPAEKRGYRESSININSVNQVNDSISVINYSNSFKKQDNTLKVVRMNDDWKVDLKYSFPNTPIDSSANDQ